VARLYSVGHGARTFEDLVAVLAEAGVTQVADVRAYPGSRRHPHFGRAALERALPAAGVAYAWLPELGGRRTLQPGGSERHPALAEEAFRAYADHTESAEFARGLERLLALAAARPTAFMCAERDPAGCHRSILADKLWSLGAGAAEGAKAAAAAEVAEAAAVAEVAEVHHLIGLGEARVHRPPPSLRVEGTHRLRYDVGAQAWLF
jgi:hypothetical protein